MPVKSDMGDLVEKTRWLIANDDQAKAIGQSGAKLARSLTYESVIDTTLKAIQQRIVKKSA